MSMVSQSFRRLTLFTEKGQASACSGMMKGEAMIILEDMGAERGKHTVKNQWFYENGIDVVRVPLPVGDYVIAK